MNPNAIRQAARADLLLLTADMLRPPKLGSIPDWVAIPDADWQQLLEAADLPRSTTTDGTTLSHALDEVFQQVRLVAVDVWADEYWRLFDSSIACPINQSSYIRRDKGTILGDLAGFYHAFGWRQNAASGERPDHLLCQLEFVGLLFAMSSRAPSKQEREVVEDALQKFAYLHMHDWLPSFCWQLCETTTVPLFGAMGSWLVMLWDALASACQWPVDRREPEKLEPLGDAENPYECAAGGLVQLGEH
jgi:putative dimethyl sulfoxide reductase chaperone